MLLSVVVCTHNRSGDLNNLLDYLLHQDQAAGFLFEIILVDNNSTDGTRQVCDGYLSRFNGRLKYFFEGKQGKSRALNHGILVSQGDIIVFTDDDCRPEQKWLYKIYTEFNKDEKLDIILGGARWDNGSRMYKNTDILRGNGLNVSVRRRVFDVIGKFDIFLGPGTIGNSAEDVEFIYRAKRGSRNIRVIDDILVFHKLRDDKSDILRFAYRDRSGHMIFWLKYALMKFDIYAFKNIYWFIGDTARELVISLIKGNYNLRVAKLHQLWSALLGLFKGLYIWVIFAPVMRAVDR